MRVPATFALATKFHALFWWVLLVLFGLLVIAETLFDLSESKLHLYGVLLLALLTLIRAVIVGIELRRRGDRAGVGWSIALIFALGLAVLVGVVL